MYQSRIAGHFPNNVTSISFPATVCSAASPCGLPIRCVPLFSCAVPRGVAVHLSRPSVFAASLFHFSGNQPPTFSAAPFADHSGFVGVARPPSGPFRRPKSHPIFNPARVSVAALPPVCSQSAAWICQSTTNYARIHIGPICIVDTEGFANSYSVYSNRVPMRVLYVASFFVSVARCLAWVFPKMLHAIYTEKVHGK